MNPKDGRELAREALRRVPEDAAALLSHEPPDRVAAVFAELPANVVRRILVHLPPDRRPAEWAETSPATLEAPVPGSIGELTEDTVGVIASGATAADAIQLLRTIRAPEGVTYLYVVDAGERLLGLVVMRDLLLAPRDQPVDAFMLVKPFALRADLPLDEAAKAALRRHYPVYPVVDEQGRLLGQVRGWRLFEREVVEIAAQSGSMVGVGKEEHVDSSLWLSFRLRHPWLQINLLTGFVAAFVVGRFESTITQLVVLAAFLPVLAGQSGNTGCQALAITLRGLTLGELDHYPVGRLLAKETLLGAMNGLLTGIVAAAAIFISAGIHDPHAPMLAVAICLAMVGACVGAGVFGVVVPLALKRLDADPVTASSIFLTTGTDIASMGLMLLLATFLVL